MDVIRSIRRGPAVWGFVLCTVLATSAVAEEESNPVLSIKGRGAGTATEKREELVTAKAYLSVDKLQAGRSCQIAVIVDIQPKWHINQNPSNPTNLIPTKVSIVTKQGSTLGQVVYPKGKPFHFEGSDQAIMVYENQVAIRGTLNVPEDAANKVEEFEIIVSYQACNDHECKAPTKIKLNGKVPVVGSNEPIKSVNRNIFGKEVR